MRFVLVGQPNCGKSTVFNQVCGYKAETGNFSGTTVTFTESRVRLAGDVVSLVDLPGTYSLSGSNLAEKEVFTYLAAHDFDCIINVLDASHLELGLALTVELMELQRPMICVLNMIDEADHLGMRVDINSLSKTLGMPVVPMIARLGRGVKEVFLTALKTAKSHQSPTRLMFSQPIEAQISVVKEALGGVGMSMPAEALGIKALEGEKAAFDLIATQQPEVLETIQTLARGFPDAEGLEEQIKLERHATASAIASRVILQGPRQFTLRDRLDNYLLHPVLGYVFLLLTLYIFFQAVFQFGGWIEHPLMVVFSQLEAWIVARVGTGTLLANMAVGLVQGISGGLGIVLPYLLPFLVGLSLLEDIGYLPRIAFLMDAFMHRIGLHGAAIVPFILGFGCNVPSIMATRTLEDKKERFIAGALSTLVPCAARLAVVFGLVAFYLGPVVALLTYLFVLIVIALAGKLLSSLLPEDSPGLILEVPPYRAPTLKAVLQKSWFRIKEFIVEAWPILIVGSLILSVLNSFNLSQYVNAILQPLTWLLGIPKSVGITIVFGVLRKELSLVMLGQVLGSMNFGALLNPVQMVTYTIFVIFYMPCLATLAVIRKELGQRSMWAIMGLSLVIATVAASFARLVASLVY